MDQHKGQKDSKTAWSFPGIQTKAPPARIGRILGSSEKNNLAGIYFDVINTTSGRCHSPDPGRSGEGRDLKERKLQTTFS